MSKLTIMTLFLLAAIGACATHDPDSQGETVAVGEAADSAVRQTGEGLGDAALSPLEDLNLRRDPIPERLAALQTPYGLPDGAKNDCETIADAVSHLTAVLGPDDDIPPPEDEEEEDTAEWAAEKSSDAALGAVSSQARSFIPFRGLVRDATGASAHQNRLSRAYRLGAERRAYLKGYGEAIGCSWPAAPLPQIDGAGQRIEFRGDAPH